MGNCCTGFGTGKFNDKFSFETENTDKGVSIHIMPKDAAKVESFQKFVEAHNEFCDKDCCC